MAAQWQALTGAARAAAARRAHHPPRPAAGDGDRQRDARQLLRRRPVRRCRGRRRGRRGHGGAKARRSSMSAANRRGPARKPVWEGDEIERIAPVIRQLAAGGAAVSVDTRKADVMTAALEAGARMINDVSALTYDERSAEVVAAAGRAGGADAPPGRARDDAGRPALRRRAGRGLSVARGADRAPRKPPASRASRS